MNQINTISENLLNYGVIGMMLLVFGFVIYYLFKKSEKNEKAWKDMGMEAMKNFHQLSKDNAANSQKLIEIRERDIIQNREFRQETREFHKELHNKIDQTTQKLSNEIRNIPMINMTSAKT